MTMQQLAGRSAVSKMLRLLRQRAGMSARPHASMLPCGVRPFSAGSTPAVASRQHLLQLQSAATTCRTRGCSAVALPLTSTFVARGGVSSLHAQAPAAAGSSSLPVEVDISVDGDLEGLSR